MTRKNSAAALLLATTMFTAVGGQGALAQQAGAGEMLGEVVVTATRQADTVNRVPLSVAAVTQRTIDEQGIKNATDLTRIVPSLTVTNQVGGVANFAIRGIVATTGAATTGVYLDDTALTKRSNSGVSQNNGAPLPVLYDLERVEVLKGPQGTLYGGSSEGGTIRIITPMPSLTKYSGNGRLEGSTLKWGSASYEYGAAVGGPIVQDKLGFRISGLVRHTGGWVDVVSAYNNGALVKEDANQTDDRAMRAALLWQINDRARAILAGYVSRSEYTGGPSTATAPLPKGQTYTTPRVCNTTVRPGTAVGAFVPGTVACPAAPTAGVFIRPSVTYGPFDYLDGRNSVAPYDNKIRGGRTVFGTGSLTLEYEFDKMSVKSITSYIEDKTIGDAPESQDPGRAQTTLENPGRTTFPLFGLYQNYAGRFVSMNRRFGIEQELRFSSPADQRPFNWVAGLFFSNARTHITYNIVGNYNASSLALYGINQQTRYGLADDPCNCVSTLDTHMADIELAGFGEANYWVTDKLKLIAGVRYSRVELKYSQLNGGVLASRPLSDPFSLASGSAINSPITPKGGIQYQLNDNNMVYANAAKGFRAGGVNNQLNPNTCAVGLALFGLTVNDIPKAYGPDSVWSYEVGGKFRLLDNKLQLNVAAFRIDWSDIQVSVAAQGCGQNWSQNGGAARSQGVDLQAQFRPFSRLTLSLAGGYTDAKYTAAVTGPKPLQGSPSIVFNKGDGFGIPKWQISASAQYGFEVLRRDAYLRVDYQYQGKYLNGPSFGAANYNPFTRQVGSQDLINLRAGVNLGRWDLNAFVNNVANSQDKMGNAGNGIGACNATTGGAGCTVYGTFQPFVAQAYQRPRAMGVQANYRF